VIVCICKSISDRVVRAARAAGALTAEAIAAATGAGTSCGCCHDTIERMIAAPCKAEPCAGCPNRAAASDAVPQGIAADRLDTP
jgi:bacterioferritin-associated ferredoxin